MNKETAEASLAKHLGTSLPLPQVAQQAIEWYLKMDDDGKKELTEKLLANLYCNDHKSFEYEVETALKGFNITEKG